MSYYTNLTLKGPSQQEIVRAIQENPREALVSPTYSDATVVYDLESEVQDGRGYKFVEPLSRRLNCLGFYVSCADGKICYRLYKNGQIIDDYDSCPGYFDSDEGGNRPEGGDA